MGGEALGEVLQGPEISVLMNPPILTLTLPTDSKPWLLLGHHLSST